MSRKASLQAWLAPAAAFTAVAWGVIRLTLTGFREMGQHLRPGIEGHLAWTAQRHQLLAAVAVLGLAGLSCWLWGRRRSAALRARALESAHAALLRRYALLERHGNDIVMVVDEAGVILEANERAAEAYGRSRGELRGAHVDALRAPGGPPTAARLAEISRRGSLVFETTHLRRDGDAFPVELSVQHAELDGRPVYVAIGRDCSERRRAEAALRASEERLRAVVRDLPVVLVALDQAGRVTLAEGRKLDAFGLFPGEPVGLSAWVLFAPLPGSEAVLRRALAGETFVEGLAVGDRRLECHFTPLRDAAGRPEGTICIALDVTDRHRLEARLKSGERMASLGRLAAGIAHEINNPLAYVASNIGFALEELRRGPTPDELEEVLQALEDGRAGAERARAIVRDLRAFSHSGEDRSAPVEVRGALQAAVALASTEVKHRAQVVQELEEVPPVLASERRLAQVFLNLVVNAAQALPPDRAPENEIRLRVFRAAAGRVAVEVRDNGCGMPPEIRAHLFEPFFTTKPVGVGIGLGLSVCHGIVQALGGTIEVESEVGKGSCFRVLLPAWTGDAPRAAPPGEGDPAVDAALRGPQARA